MGCATQIVQNRQDPAKMERIFEPVLVSEPARAVQPAGYVEVKVLIGGFSLLITFQLISREIGGGEASFLSWTK